MAEEIAGAFGSDTTKSELMRLAPLSILHEDFALAPLPSARCS